jgi:hypothetical protein
MRSSAFDVRTATDGSMVGTAEAGTAAIRAPRGSSGLADTPTAPRGDRPSLIDPAIVTFLPARAAPAPRSRLVAEYPR